MASKVFLKINNKLNVKNVDSELSNWIPVPKKITISNLQLRHPTPPFGSGWVTSSRLFSGVWMIFTAVLLLYRTDDLSSGKEPCLLRHTGGLRYADVFPPPPAPHIAPVAWI
jgi:hypothetical protein